jgi:hypothetical protein
MAALEDTASFLPEIPRRVLFSGRAPIERKETRTPRSGWYFAFRIDLEATLPFVRRDTISAFCDASKVYVAYLESVSLS